MMTALFFFAMFSLVSLIFLKSVENLTYLLIFSCILPFFFIFMTYSDSFSSFEMGVYSDGMSVNLVILSFWVTLLMSFASFKIFRFNEYFILFNLLIYFLALVLMISFYVGSYLLFYFFFEISLIPTFIIIMGWGYQPERLQAGVYFIFYTLTASLPLLFGVIYLQQLQFTLKYILVFPFFTPGHEVNFYLGLIFIMAFLVKLPMFYTHLWLPKAHVEAPVSGSMILAGVLLKLGGYGLMRISMTTVVFMMKLGAYLFGLSLAGMIFIGFICCRLNDFKALVAYSSVAHMGMVICGVLTLYLWGFEGSLMMMISHGIASSGLFCMVNMYYERLNSRSFFINKGLIMIFPVFSLLLFLLASANIAGPPTINLMSEIFLMGSMMSFDKLMFLMFPLGSFLGAVFTIFMYSYSQHGKLYYLSFSFMGVSMREIHTIFLHVLPLNFFILNPSLFLII